MPKVDTVFQGRAVNESEVTSKGLVIWPGFCMEFDIPYKLCGFEDNSQGTLALLLFSGDKKSFVLESLHCGPPRVAVSHPQRDHRSSSWASYHRLASPTGRSDMGPSSGGSSFAPRSTYEVLAAIFRRLHYTKYYWERALKRSRGQPWKVEIKGLHLGKRNSTQPQ